MLASKGVGYCGLNEISTSVVMLSELKVQSTYTVY